MKGRQMSKVQSSEEIKYTGQLDIKRLYLPGVKISRNCPECGSEIVWNGSNQYLSYPMVGEPEQFYLYCEDCDREWSVDYRLELSMYAEFEEL